MKRLKTLLLISLLSLAFWAQADDISEYSLKSAYILNFAQGTRWPKKAFTTDDSPLVIGILGEDPFGANLDNTLNGKVAHKRPIVVKRFTSFDPKNIEALGDCQILFISQSEQDHVVEILAALQDDSMLTVSEIDQFPSLGGMIFFDKQGSQISLVVNPKSAKKAGLTLSMDLLQNSTLYPKVDAAKVKELYADGITLYMNGDLKEAIKKWEECLQEDPGNANVLGNIEKAKSRLRMIKKLNVSN